MRRSASVGVYTDIAFLGEELDAIKSTLDKQSATLWDFKYNLDVHSGSSQLVHTVLDRVLGQLQQQREDFRELQQQAEAARDRVGLILHLLLSVPTYFSLLDMETALFTDLTHASRQHSQSH